ncbi:hypothetical protein NX059_009244 [Plenodomus lindquistii]|nr:hypothetical protein NX059_009244 [Plenodomus lindquistii]
MNVTNVGNEFVDRGIPTYHVCTQCVAFYGRGYIEFLGRIGCLMPAVTDETKDLYKDWVVTNENEDRVEFERCFRCFVSNVECCAVPEELGEELDSVALTLKELKDNGTTTRRPDPAYNADQAARGNAPAEFLVELTKFTAVERRLKELELGNLCKRVSRQISREYAPHALKLTLHSGATGPEDDPCANARPNDRQRDKQSVVVQAEASRRTHDMFVDAESSRQIAQAGSPSKKRKGTIIPDGPKSLDRRAAIVLEISGLEAAREDAVSAKKGALTRRINLLNKEYAELDKKKT